MTKTKRIVMVGGEIKQREELAVQTLRTLKAMLVPDQVRRYAQR